MRGHGDETWMILGKVGESQSISGCSHCCLSHSTAPELTLLLSLDLIPLCNGVDVKAIPLILSLRNFNTREKNQPLGIQGKEGGVRSDKCGRALKVKKTLGDKREGRVLPENHVLTLRGLTS